MRKSLVAAGLLTLVSLANPVAHAQEPGEGSATLSLRRSTVDVSRSATYGLEARVQAYLECAFPLESRPHVVFRPTYANSPLGEQYWKLEPEEFGFTFQSGMSEDGAPRRHSYSLNATVKIEAHSRSPSPRNETTLVEWTQEGLNEADSPAVCTPQGLSWSLDLEPLTIALHRNESAFIEGCENLVGCERDRESTRGASRAVVVGSFSGSSRLHHDAVAFAGLAALALVAIMGVWARGRPPPGAGRGTGR